MYNIIHFIFCNKKFYIIIGKKVYFLEKKFIFFVKNAKFMINSIFYSRNLVKFHFYQSKFCNLSFLTVEIW